VGPSGAVWAFEPATEPAALLARSIEINATPWVRLQQQALSDHSGSGWLHQPGQSELNALVASPFGATAGAGEKVELTSLDACMERHGWSQVDLLKIDAEGEEERILNGGQRFFAELAPLVLFELRAGDELHLELIERFARMDYRCYRLVPGLDALVPFKATEGVDGYLLNLFAVPADRVVSLIEAQIVIDLAQTSPPDLQDEERKAVASAQGQLALGRSLAQAWANTAAEPAATPAWEWLAGWAVAHDNSRSLGSRYGALHAAYNSLKSSLKNPPTPATMGQPPQA
jgi:FkbM family methyltransferase